MNVWRAGESNQSKYGEGIKKGFWGGVGVSGLGSWKKTKIRVESGGRGRLSGR